MKAYTDLSQSKKLAKVLPLKSADMYYCYGMNIHTKGWSFDDTPTIIDNSNQIDVHADIPCWSLAALIDVIPYTIYKSDNEFYRLGIDKGYDDYAVWYNNNGFTVTDLDLTEGRATGIPTIQKKLRENGSPKATIETDESRSYFLIDIPARKDFVQDAEIEKEPDTERIKLNMSKMCPRYVQDMSDVTSDNFVGACVEMIEKLHEQKLL